MTNPWHQQPSSAPYVIPKDAPAVSSFNSEAYDLHKIRLELMPEPYLSQPDAPIVLLNLNPVFAESEIHFHCSDPYFMDRCRRTMLGLEQDYPFYQ